MTTPSRRVAHRLAGLSLRTRVLVIAVSILAAGLLIGSLVVIGALQRYLADRVDSQLRAAADVYAWVPPDLPFASRPSGTAPGGIMLGSPHVTYLDPAGQVEGGQQPDPADPLLPHLDTAAVAARGGAPFTVLSGDGTRRWRVVALPRATGGVLAADPSAAADGTSVVVAVPLDEVDATVARTRTVCLATGVSLLALLTVAGWFAVRASLRPLNRIEETSAAIARGDLSRRVPQLAAPGTEVGRVSVALNTMLDHNEAAFAARADSEARMRRFVADASHELRTPLVGIKGFTKLYRMGAMPDRADVDHAMARIESQSHRLTELVEDLLLLAHIDEHSATGPPGGFPLHRAPTDLRTLAVEALHDARALDPARTVLLTGPDGGPPAEAPTLADEARLRQVVTNLVGNAVAHTPPGTPIRIGVGTCSGAAVLEVADQGPGMAPEQAARAFDRFYRADPSRSRATGGAGLGLAIVWSLVTAHNGQIELRTAQGAGTTFRVLLPAADRNDDVRPFDED